MTKTSINNQIMLGGARRAAVALMVALVLLGGCGRDRRQVSAALLERGRDLVKGVDSDGAESLGRRIDTLQTRPSPPPDTLLARVCAQVARELRLARRYKQLWSWVSDAGERLER